MDISTLFFPINFHSCEICSYRTKFAFNLGQHLTLHRTRLKTDLFTCEHYYPEVYECKLCDFQSDLKINLTHHHKIVHEKVEVSFDIDSVKEYYCDQCGFETFSILLLVDHYFSADSKCVSDLPITRENSLYYKQENLKPRTLKRGSNCEDIRWFCCANCSYKTKMRYHLNRHIRCKHVKHEDIEWFSCGFCSYKSKDKPNLKKHILFTHSKHEDIRWFYCQYCSYKSKYKSHLKTHIVGKHTSHEDISWFCCEYCPHKAKRKCDLKTHIIAKHKMQEDIKWLCCTYCSFKSKTMGNLNRHINAQHKVEDIRWLYCQYCSFKTKTNLKRHIISQHTNPEDILWFYCGHCSYKAKQKDNLKIHVHRHTRD